MVPRMTIIEVVMPTDVTQSTGIPEVTESDTGTEVTFQIEHVLIVAFKATYAGFVLQDHIIMQILMIQLDVIILSVSIVVSQGT